MAFLGGNYANELEAALDARRLADHIEALALTVYTAEELAGLTPELRTVLDMLFKRRMRAAGADLPLAECLAIRQQFDQYHENRGGNATSVRLASRLR